MENLLTSDKSHFAMRFHVQATNHKRTYKNAVHTTLGNRNCERKGEGTKVSFFIHQLLSYNNLCFWQYAVVKVTRIQSLISFFVILSKKKMKTQSVTFESKLRSKFRY